MTLALRVAARYAAMTKKVKVQRPAMIKAVKEAFLYSGGNYRVLKQDRTPKSSPILVFWWPANSSPRLDWDKFTRLLKDQGIKVKEQTTNSVTVQYPLTRLMPVVPRAKSGPPEGTAGYIKLAVLAGAYPRGDPKETLHHAIWVGDKGEALGDKTVCNRIKIVRLADRYGDDRFCPVCETRVRKAGLPHLTKFELFNAS